MARSSTVLPSFETRSCGPLLRMRAGHAPRAHRKRGNGVRFANIFR